LAERRKQEAEKHRMLREVLEELALGARFPSTIQLPNNQPLPPSEKGQARRSKKTIIGWRARMGCG
jgi:hypothetical protein